MQSMKNLRDTFRDMTPDEMREASREAKIAEWRETNRFCGRCGAEMKPHDDPCERRIASRLHPAFADDAPEAASFPSAGYHTGWLR